MSSSRPSTHARYALMTPPWQATATVSPAWPARIPSIAATTRSVNSWLRSVSGYASHRPVPGEALLGAAEHQVADDLLGPLLTDVPEDLDLPDLGQHDRFHVVVAGDLTTGVMRPAAGWSCTRRRSTRRRGAGPPRWPACARAPTAEGRSSPVATPTRRTEVLLAVADQDERGHVVQAGEVRAVEDRRRFGSATAVSLSAFGRFRARWVDPGTESGGSIGFGGSEPRLETSRRFGDLVDGPGDREPDEVAARRRDRSPTREWPRRRSRPATSGTGRGWFRAGARRPTRRTLPRPVRRVGDADPRGASRRRRDGSGRSGPRSRRAPPSPERRRAPRAATASVARGTGSAPLGRADRRGPAGSTSQPSRHPVMAEVLREALHHDGVSDFARRSVPPDRR